MKRIGWKPPVQHLTKSGGSSGGIHSPTIADGNRLELKVQEKRPHDCAQTVGLSCSERRSVGHARNMSGSRRRSSRPHARYRRIARSRPSSGHCKRVECNLLCTSDRSCQGSEDGNCQRNGMMDCLNSQTTFHCFFIHE